MRKYFTFEEVQELIPQLEYHFKILISEKRELSRLSLRLKKMGHPPQLLEETSVVDPKIPPEVVELQRQLREHYEVFKKHVLAVESLGGEIKNFELGRVDFHSMEGGQETLLVWQLGVTEGVHRQELESVEAPPSTASSTF